MLIVFLFFVGFNNKLINLLVIVLECLYVCNNICLIVFFVVNWLKNN